MPGTLPGKSWDATSNEMMYLGNGMYYYTFTNVPAGSYEFKIAMGDWTEYYGADGLPDGANYVINNLSTQDITIYYDDLMTHRAVTSINYVFADISLDGTGISAKLVDPGLSGIYSTAITLPAGTYSDITMQYGSNSYTVDPFKQEKMFPM